MFSDLLKVTEAFLLFALVVFVPGYVVGWALDVFTFRQRLLSTRCVIAVPLSIGICPIISYYLWRLSFVAVVLFYAACASVFLLLLVRERQHWLSAVRSAGKRELIYFGILAAWIAGAMLLLVDMQIDHRLYFPTVTYDYALRSAFTSAISQTGVPPQTPYFFPGRHFALRYHYFWLILCGIVQRVSGQTFSAKQAVLSGTIWCGIGLFAVIALYLRFFQPKANSCITRRTIIAFALLTVTGLDICPIFLEEAATHTYVASIDWWNSDQVTAWIDAILWVPHHLSGLIVCLMGFLVLCDATKLQNARKVVALSLFTGFMFASALGLTIYVCLVFAIFLLAWLVMSLVRGQRKHAAALCISGSAALAVSIPFLLELFAKSPGGAQGGGSPAIPLRFAVRQLLALDIVMGVVDSYGWRANLTNLIALPLNYFLELGFFFLIGIIQCRQLWRGRQTINQAQICFLTMLAVSIVFCSFVRSSVIANNDLGCRGFLFAQFVLLIWGAELLSDGLLSTRNGFWSQGWEKRALLVAMLALGTMGTAYELAKIRFYPLQYDTTSIVRRPWLSPDHHLGSRTFALRQMYEELKRLTPPSAVFQHNPDALPQDSFHSLYADRQVAAETLSCAVHFGGDPNLCQSRIGKISALFDDPRAYQASQIDRVCSDLSIDVLVVQNTDAVWKDPKSWVWQRRPLLANEYARAFSCSSILESKTKVFGGVP